MATDTNVAVAGNASTQQHTLGVVSGAAIGYTIAGGVAALATTLSGGLLAPVAVTVTPGLGALIGGWLGHYYTKSS